MQTPFHIESIGNIFVQGLVGTSGFEKKVLLSSSSAQDVVVLEFEVTPQRGKVTQNLGSQPVTSLATVTE